MPTPFFAPYALTKHALESLASSLRSEVKAFGIYVSLINPGGYNTGFNKKFIAKKYEWLDMENLDPLVYKQMKKSEKMIYRYEMQSTKSIVRQIVKAVESSSPKKRYTAPIWQAFGVFFIRMFG
jgi:short-subunit dehydrogenase